MSVLVELAKICTVSEIILRCKTWRSGDIGYSIFDKIYKRFWENIRRPSDLHYREAAKENILSELAFFSCLIGEIVRNEQQ